MCFVGWGEHFKQSDASLTLPPIHPPTTVPSFPLWLEHSCACAFVCISCACADVIHATDALHLIAFFAAITLVRLVMIVFLQPLIKWKWLLGCGRARPSGSSGAGHKQSCRGES